MTSAVTPREAWQEATIERNDVLTPRVRRVLLRPHHWRPFLPGQHIDVRLTAPDGYQARRSYSVASAPETAGTLELAVERLEDGEVSPWFHEFAQRGDTIEIRGPFAEHFVWRAEPGVPVLLVGGGSGVAPLMSMVRHRAHVAMPPPMVLLYSARTWDDVIFRDELLAHEDAQRGLRVVLCLTRDTPRRPADVGRRIDRELLAGIVGDAGAWPHLTYVCGTNGFVGVVADHLVALGVRPATIRTERFGGA